MKMSKLWHTATFIIACVVTFSAPLRAEDYIHCKQLEQMLTELRQLRQLLDSQQRLPGQTNSVRIEVGNAPLLGSKAAPLTVVEFTDYQCPFCQRFYQEVFPDLKKNYIDSGKVRFYSADLPLDIHQNALRAAQAGRCAHEQGQFWPMHDRMQATPERLEIINLVGHAQELGLNIVTFRECVESGRFSEAIRRSANDAISKGANGTPAFVIGKSTVDGVEGELIVGPAPYGVFEQKLRALIPVN